MPTAQQKAANSTTQPLDHFMMGQVDFLWSTNKQTNGQTNSKKNKKEKKEKYV